MKGIQPKKIFYLNILKEGMILVFIFVYKIKFLSKGGFWRPNFEISKVFKGDFLT